MPIRNVSITVAGALDVHLIRGTDGPDFDGRFLVVPIAGGETTLAKHKKDHQDFDYEFRPTFDAKLKTIAGREVYEGFGFRVDRQTGSVSFLFPTPPLTRHNFIVELCIRENVGGTQGLSPIPIRVHVHPGVRELRLTPPVISVPVMPLQPDMPQPVQTWPRRFALRAEFTDDTVGDLTRHPGVSWSLPGVGSSKNGAILAFDAVAGQEARVIATWDGAPGLQAEAKLKALKPWSAMDADTPAIEFIDGHRSMWERFLGEPALNTTIRPEAVPNILFIGAGFKQEDRDIFRGITDKVVHDLKRDALTSPYDVLSTSMNFWRITPAASLRGGRKVFSEVYTTGTGADLQALPVPPAKRITATGNVQWTLSNLIYHIGLPIPAEVSPTVRPNKELIDEWKAVRGDALPAVNVSDELIAAWRELGTRQFIDVPDEFPLIGSGLPPQAKSTDEHPPLRFEGHELEEIYELLRGRMAANGVGLDGTGNLARLGSLWASRTFDPMATPPSNPAIGDFWPDTSTSPPVSKRWDGSTWVATPQWPFEHRGLIVMIAASEGGRANANDFVKVPLASGVKPIPVKPVSGKRALELNYAAAPSAEVSRATWRTIAHEISHTFGLGDEYNEFPHSEGASEAEYEIFGNVMAGAIQPNAGDPIDPNKIKWNWLRARKGAVLIKAAALRSGMAIPQVEIPLAPEDANQFSINDKVFLRTRLRRLPLTGPLNSGAQATQHSALLTIVDKSVATPTPPEAPYETLVAASTPAMTAADLAHFVARSVVYLPLDADDPPPNYGPHQRLISKRVFNYIVANKRPLSPEPFDAAAEAKNAGRTQTPPSDTYPVFFCGKHRPRIIGLYRGAARHALGAFRPAGECMMRNDHAENEFCHVCRYVLVDMIDPRKHWEIDHDYEPKYPD